MTKSGVVYDLTSKGFNQKQIEILYPLCMANVDISDFDKNSSIEEILSTLKLTKRFIDLLEYGVDRGWDMSKYASNSYNYKQLHQIVLGLKDNLDVSQYDSPSLKASQMGYKRRRLLGELIPPLEI